MGKSYPNFTFKCVFSAALLTALLLGACDSVEKKVLPCNGHAILHHDEFSTVINESIRLNIHQNDTVNCSQLLDVRNPVFGSIAMQSNAIIYSPAENFTGKDSLSYSVTNGLKVHEAVVIIWVKNPCAPNIKSDTVNAFLNARISIAPAANDTFCEGTIMAVAIAPVHGDLHALPNNQVQYIPHHGFTGTDFFIYRMCFENTCAETKVIIHVHDIEACHTTFIPQNDHLQVVAGQTARKAIAELIGNDGGCDNDLDGNSFLVVSTPQKGTVSVVGGQLEYVPNVGTSGVETLRYRVCRISKPGHCEEANIEIQID
jgi:hypothetical protein